MHAVIEVDDGLHTICDNGSRNKTHRGKVSIKLDKRVKKELVRYLIKIFNKVDA